MQFYFRENKKGLLYAYYNVTDAQFEYIVTHQYKTFPPRFFTKKLFCPMLSLDYAKRVAEERANWASEKTDKVHILRFLIKSSFLEKYSRGSLDNEKVSIAIPYGDLTKLNQQIIGYIEKVESFDLQELCQSTCINI